MNTVIKLCERYYGSNRCVTADNFFSSILLATTLWSNKLEYLGTIRQNKIEIPVEFKAAKTRKVESAVFGFQNELTLVSYVPKVKKAVILVSTNHHERNINALSNKPEIIMDYNKFKGNLNNDFFS